MALDVDLEDTPTYEAGRTYHSVDQAVQTDPPADTIDCSTQTHDVPESSRGGTTSGDQRSDPPPRTVQPQWRRDEEFWFEDGTIILVVRGVGFRVYRGILAAVSPVFQDMLSVAQPDEVALPQGHGEAGASPALQRYPACPIVHISGDSPRDWRYVMRDLMVGSDNRRLVSLLPI